MRLICLCLFFLFGVVPLAQAQMRLDQGPHCGEALKGMVAFDWSRAAVDIRRPTAQDGLSAEERQLYDMLMRLRAEAGLPAVPLSPALTLVAGRHALDTSLNILGSGRGLRPGTNMHSWSDAPYYADLRQPRAMWQAPQRLRTGYCGWGYEISAVGYRNLDDVVRGWLGSPAHRSVILNRGVWAGMRWRAVGIGVQPATAGGPAVYHVVWGALPDGGQR